MENLFENNYTRDKKMFKELYSYIFFKTSIRIVIFSLMAFAIALAIVGWIIFGTSPLFVLIAVPFLVLLNVLSYYSAYSTAIKREKELTEGKALEVSAVATEDYVQNMAEGGKTQLPYDNVRNVARTKSFILIRSKTNLIYIFKKDAFNKGSEDEFIEFLRKKGCKVR